MKYMLLIVSGDPKLPQITDADMGPIFARFQQLTTDLQAQGKFHHSARLRPNVEGKTVKIGRGGSRVVIDGPFTETKEAVGGYYLIDCASEAEAVEWAKKFPPYFHIEVRAVWEL